jgi:hypothetical protein
MATHTTIYQSTGHDGYSAGTWGYVLRIGDHMWCDGGFASRPLARAAARRRARFAQQ